MIGMTNHSRIFNTLGEGPGERHRLKLLQPRSQLNLPCPHAAVLAMYVEILLRYRVWVQPLVLSAAVSRLRPATRDATVDNEVCNVNIFRGELSRHALSHSPQGELAHRKWRRAR